jgi:hypothetical protein
VRKINYIRVSEGFSSFSLHDLVHEPYISLSLTQNLFRLPSGTGQRPTLAPAHGVCDELGVAPGGRSLPSSTTLSRRPGRSSTLFDGPTISFA